MDITLFNDIKVTLSDGNYWKYKPRLLLDNSIVMAGPYEVAEQYDIHLIDTIGSNDEMGVGDDGFRFNSESLVLESVVFQLPQSNVVLKGEMQEYINSPVVTGSLKLTDSIDYSQPPTDVRYYDVQQDVLLCLINDFSDMWKTGKILRINLCKNLDLIFSDLILCGWALHEPWSFIVDSFRHPEAVNCEDEALKEIFKKTLDYFSYPNFNYMDEGDVNLKNSLISLAESIQLENGAIEQRKILKEWIIDVVDNYYS